MAASAAMDPFAASLVVESTDDAVGLLLPTITAANRIASGSASGIASGVNTGKPGAGTFQTTLFGAGMTSSGRVVRTPQHLRNSDSDDDAVGRASAAEATGPGPPRSRPAPASTTLRISDIAVGMEVLCYFDDGIDKGFWKATVVSIEQAAGAGKKGTVFEVLFDDGEKLRDVRIAMLKPLSAATNIDTDGDAGTCNFVSLPLKALHADVES